MTYNPPPSGWPGEPHQGQPPSSPPPIQQQQSGFFSALFDFRFDRFVTPSVVRVLYALGFAAIILVYLVYIVIAFYSGPIFGLVVLLLGWIVPLLYLTLWRVMLEFFVAVIRMSEDIHHRGPPR